AAEQLAGRVGPDRLFAVRFERLFTNGGATVARLFAFLDLDMTESGTSRDEASAAPAGAVRGGSPPVTPPPRPHRPPHPHPRQRRYVTQRTDPSRLDRLDARLRTPS